MRFLKKTLLRNGMQGVLAASAWLVRTPGRAALGRRVLRALGSSVAEARGLRPVTEVRALGEGWQRAFASPR